MPELGFHIPSLIVYLVNFFLLVVLLYLFAYKPILGMIDQRSARIRESLEEAERARNEAARTQEDLRRQMEEARREGQSMIDEARRVADRIRAEEQAKAQEELERMRERALAEIQRERDAAIEEVRRNFVDLALDAAERVVEQSLDRKGHEALVQRVLREAETATNNRGA